METEMKKNSMNLESEIEMKHYDSLTRGHKKKNGVFYTPMFLAEYTARKILQFAKKDGTVSEETKILDPACGNGLLLLAAANEARKMKIKGLSFYGVDKERNAIEECRENLGKKICKKDIFLQKSDAIYPFMKKNIKGWEKINNKLGVVNYDIAISNPPWGADLSKYDKKELSEEFELAQGQFDIYDLFIEIILRNLKPKGYYGIILPDSIFNQEQWRMRNLLLKRTSIKLIARLGEKIFKNVNRACTVIVGKNVNPRKTTKIQCVRLMPGHRADILNSAASLCSIEKKIGHKVSQDRFLKNEFQLFDIDCKDSENILISKIATGKTRLSDFVCNSRGAEISKRGNIVQCENCKLWLPLPRAEFPICQHCKVPINKENIEINKIIFEKRKKNKAIKKLKVGEDLSRYLADKWRWIDTSKQGINYKEENLYAGAKILVRKTGVGITASIDYENALTNQVVYILKLREELKERLTPEFVLGVLNSRAITYYLLKKHGEIEWKSHPYLTQKTLISLPMPVLRKTKKFKKSVEKITTLVYKITKENKMAHEYDAQIEREVAELFQLNKKDYRMIYDQLENAEQLIPIKRLQKISIKDIFSDGV